ncbi:uncharacterized protein LOC116845731 [Odontomachus brunneus]|uniref:uncharacterized protein LOC116845731 n=1 Tax=Odontomachus brunneus TaxID=486640 RepID=UPI0013F2455C|nr:uncharacterized protein LOC116845731 [Odontomachus brunneus]
MTPLMAPLPRERVTPAPPFQVAGVDYAGPVTLTAVRGRGRSSIKGYIAVFVCFTTRAIHLELVGDYSSEAFLAAFQRFSARRGVPAVLYSDQGTTFIGADRALRAQLRTALDVGGPVARALAADGTEWRFVPPSAPHFGGLWEAGVRSVKHHLRRVLGERLLSVEEFSTWLTRVEAWTLSPLTQDPGDLDVLSLGPTELSTIELTTPRES